MPQSVLDEMFDMAVKIYTNKSAGGTLANYNRAFRRACKKEFQITPKQALEKDDRFLLYLYPYTFTTYVFPREMVMADEAEAREHGMADYIDKLITTMRSRVAHEKRQWTSANK